MTSGRVHKLIEYWAWDVYILSTVLYLVPLLDGFSIILLLNHKPEVRGTLS